MDYRAAVPSRVEPNRVVRDNCGSQYIGADSFAALWQSAVSGRANMEHLMHVLRYLGTVAEPDGTDDSVP
jgi:hypothetical protein